MRSKHFKPVVNSEKAMNLGEEDRSLQGWGNIILQKEEPNDVCVCEVCGRTVPRRDAWIQLQDGVTCSQDCSRALIEMRKMKKDQRRPSGDIG